MDVFGGHDQHDRHLKNEKNKLVLTGFHCFQCSGSAQEQWNSKSFWFSFFSHAECNKFLVFLFIPRTKPWFSVLPFFQTWSILGLEPVTIWLPSLFPTDWIIATQTFSQLEAICTHPSTPSFIFTLRGKLPLFGWLDSSTLFDSDTRLLTIFILMC